MLSRMPSLTASMKRISCVAVLAGEITMGVLLLYTSRSSVAGSGVTGGSLKATSTASAQSRPANANLPQNQQPQTEERYQPRNQLADVRLDDKYLLESGRADEAIRERALRNLRNTMQRIKGVADDVHSLAIAQGSEETAQGRRLSLRALIADTVEELHGMAGEREVRIEVQEPIPDVQVDATRVELVLVNLVGNAVKYSDPSEEDPWVRLGVQRTEDGYWRIAVSDNGVGIPSEMQDLVFEQFVRAHPDVADGTGLGLAIAREAVEQMGGRIWLESRDGIGTTFHFTVLDPPAARED